MSASRKALEATLEIARRESEHDRLMQRNAQYTTISNGVLVREIYNDGLMEQVRLG